MSDIILILLPGAMYLWVLFAGQSTMQEVLFEKDTRVLPRILSCPVTPTQYILAKMLRCWLLCCVTVILLLIASALLFGIKWGNPLALALVVGIWALSMTALLAVIYSVMRTREQANAFSSVVLLLLGMMGGSMFPYDDLPKSLQMLGQFTPNRWAVLLLDGVVRAKAPADLVRPFASLLILGIAGCLLAFALFRRQLAGGARK